MKKVVAMFVRYLAPGSFVAEAWTAPVESLDPNAVPWPENAYAFTLHTRADVVDGADTFTGKPEQIGPVYYHRDSVVKTLEEVAASNTGRDDILLSNMRCNDWGRVVYSRWGNWPQPFDPAKAEVLP